MLACKQHKRTCEQVAVHKDYATGKELYYMCARSHQNMQKHAEHTHTLMHAQPPAAAIRHEQGHLAAPGQAGKQAHAEHTHM